MPVQPADVAFLIDVDNTLLDNGIIVADLRRSLRETLGPEGERRYWEIFEELFRDPGFADYLGARHVVYLKAGIRNGELTFMLHGADGASSRHSTPSRTPWR